MFLLIMKLCEKIYKKALIMSAFISLY